jgi:hypothetical protein
MQRDIDNSLISMWCVCDTVRAYHFRRSAAEGLAPGRPTARERAGPNVERLFRRALRLVPAVDHRAAALSAPARRVPLPVLRRGRRFRLKTQAPTQPGPVHPGAGAQVCGPQRNR